MFETLKDVKTFLKEFSDVDNTRDKTNGKVYVHLARKSKSPDLFTVKLETNAFYSDTAASYLKHKYDAIMQALGTMGYGIVYTEAFQCVRELDPTTHLGVYVKQMTFCRKDWKHE